MNKAGRRIIKIIKKAATGIATFKAELLTSVPKPNWRITKGIEIYIPILKILGIRFFKLRDVAENIIGVKPIGKPNTIVIIRKIFCESDDKFNNDRIMTIGAGVKIVKKISLKFSLNELIETLIWYCLKIQWI